MRPRRRRRRWGLPVLVLVAGLIGGLILHVDVDVFRGRAVDAVSSWLDQPVTLGGRLGFRLWDGPALVLPEIEVGEHALTAREARIGLRFWPLLVGRFEPRTLSLIEPRLRLERFAVWRSTEGGWPSLPLERLDVVDGILEGQAGPIVEGVGIAVVPAAANGPFDIRAGFRRGGDQFRLDATIGRLEASRPGGAVVKLQGGGLDISLTAAVNRGQQGLEVGGPIKIAVADAPAALARLGLVATPTSGPATAEAKLVWADGRVRLSELSITGSGFDVAGSVDLAESLRAGEAQLAFRRLEIERWLGTLTALLDGAPGRDLSVTLSAEAALLRGGLVRQLRTELRLLDGQLALRQLNALLPGGTELSGFGRVSSTGPQPVYEGEIDVVSDNLRTALSWLGLEPRGIAPDRLRRAAFSARLTFAGDRLTVPNFDLKLDTSRMFGGGSLTIGASPRLDLKLAIDRVPFDPYQPLLAAAMDLGLAGTITISADLVTWHGLPLRDVDIDAAIDGRRIDLRRLRIAEIAGARLAVTGRTDLARSQAELSFDLTTTRPAELLRQLGQADGAAASTGATIAAAGRIEGSLSELALSGAVVAPNLSSTIDGILRLEGERAPTLEPGPELGRLIDRLAAGHGR
jgi:hypothetical protein